MTQPTYGQNPNPYVPSGQGQPPTPSPDTFSAPPFATPGAPGPTAPPPYSPAGPPPPSPAGPPPAYAAPPVSAAPVKKKSKLLGVIGFFLVLLAAVALFYTLYMVSVGLFELVNLTDWDSITGTLDANAISQLLMDNQGLQIWAYGVTISAGAGLIGFILSIIATVSKRGRVLGVFGIILGVLAPIVCTTVPMVLALATL